MVVKFCSICKMEKSISSFILDKRKAGRYRSQCKVCTNVSQKKWRSSSSGKIASKQWAKTEKFKNF